MTAPVSDRADSLADAAARRNLLYGAAIGTFDLSIERRRSAIVRDCSIITPEYEMKWKEISPDGRKRDYGAADTLVAFAAQHGMAVHGHTLWWHEAFPPDLTGRFAEAALSFLRETIRRYAGQMHSWDVVNEPLAPEQGRSDGLRNSRFLEAFGSDYIGLAYREAARLDPAAILVLNEMGIEDASPDAERKRRLSLALLERELAKGTPIRCLGIQSHLVAREAPRQHPELRAFLREVDRMGLSVMVTEMDVSDTHCPRNRAERDRIVAETYRAYLELVLEESTVLAISTWGLSDDRSWLQSFRPRADGAALRPLPLDSSLRRKPAWHAIRAALGSAERDRPESGNINRSAASRPS